VGADAAKSTLVRRGFSGEFERLRGHPAEAALELILDRYAVDEASRNAISAVLQERRRVLDDLVVDRLDLLVKLANGASEHDRAQAINALRRAMAPIAKQGSLGDRIRQHLPADAATEHNRLEREYMRAAIDDRVAMLEAENSESRQRGLRLRARAIEILVSLGAEVQQAYERTLVQEGERLDEIVRMLDLTPEQERTVRQIVGQHAAITRLDKEAEDSDHGRFEVFVKVAAELSPEQRRRLVAHIRGEQ